MFIHLQDHNGRLIGAIGVSYDGGKAYYSACIVSDSEPDEIVNIEESFKRVNGRLCDAIDCGHTINWREKSGDIENYNGFVNIFVECKIAKIGVLPIKEFHKKLMMLFEKIDDFIYEYEV